MHDIEVTGRHLVDGLFTRKSEVDLEIRVKTLDCEFYCLYIVEVVVTNKYLSGSVPHITDHIFELCELVPEMSNRFRVQVPLLKLLRNLNELIHNRVVHLLKLRVRQGHGHLTVSPHIILMLLLNILAHFILEIGHDVPLLLHVPIYQINLNRILRLEVVIDRSIFILEW